MNLSFLIYLISILFMGFYFVFYYFEIKIENKYFLEARIEEKTNFIYKYIQNKQKSLSQLGIELSQLQILSIAVLIIVAFGMLPIILREPFLLCLFFMLIGALTFDLFSRWYTNRFYVRFEWGLRQSALPIGIDTLTATHDTKQAIKDILELSDDVIIRREFLNIYNLIQSLDITAEKAMLIRSSALNIPIYMQLARYTITMTRYGCRTDESWHDILEELNDRDTLRTSIRAKTNVIRLSAYAFFFVFLIALLLFYRAIVPLMTGAFPFVFAIIIALIFIGTYRISQIGGEKI